jgi:hypothetical protein
MDFSAGPYPKYTVAQIAAEFGVSPDDLPAPREDSGMGPAAWARWGTMQPAPWLSSHRFSGTFRSLVPHPPTCSSRVHETEALGARVASPGSRPPPTTRSTRTG